MASQNHAMAALIAVAAALGPARASATSQVLLIGDAPAHVAGLTQAWTSLEQRFGFSDVRIAVAGSSHEIGEDVRQFLGAPGNAGDLRLVWIAGPGADAANSVCPAWGEEFVRPQVPTILVAPSCIKFLVQASSTYEQVADAQDAAPPPPDGPGVVFINTSDESDDPPELASALASSPAPDGDGPAVRALIAALACAPKAHVSLDFSPSSSAWHIAPPLCPAPDATSETAAPAPAEEAAPSATTSSLPLPPPPRPDADVQEMPAVPPVPVAAAPLPEPGAPAFAPPVTGTIVSDFGSTAGGKANKGVDYEVPPGSSVKAAESGEVVYVGELPGYGKVIAIKHGNEWATVYGHTSDISVTKGQVIAKGQDIARVDPANRLHFEVRRRGKPVDPRTTMAQATP